MDDSGNDSDMEDEIRARFPLKRTEHKPQREDKEGDCRRSSRTAKGGCSGLVNWIAPICKSRRDIHYIVN